MEETVATGYEFAPNETVVLKAQDVEIDGAKTMMGSRAELMLTNLNIVYPQKNMFGKIKGYHVWPLSEIRIVDGVPQCRLDSSEFMTQKLEVYLNHENLSFVFNGLENKKEIRAWVEAINQLLTGHSAPEENLKTSKFESFMESDKFINTVGSVFETINDTYDHVVGDQRRRYTEKLNHVTTVHCPSCNASLEGEGGTTMKCPFCGTKVTIPLS